MPTGECIKADFIIIGTNPIEEVPSIGGIIPASPVAQCCSKTTFFASTPSDDVLKNDKTSFLWVLSPLVSAAEMTLQKADASGTFIDVQTLNNNDFGTFYALNFNNDDDNRKYIGYLLDMRLVILDDGAGLYRVKNVIVTILGNKSLYSNEFCLSEYSPALINGTVRIETYTNGIRGAAGSQTDFIDFNSINWYNQIRLSGMFGFTSSEYTREEVEYNNGQKQWVVDEQKEKYILKLKPIEQATRNFVKTDILQADEIIVTDYNNTNPDEFIGVYVKGSGGFEPRHNIKEALPVDITFDSAFNNQRKRRC
jgi:hypothetical protein